MYKNLKKAEDDSIDSFEKSHAIARPRVTFTQKHVLRDKIVAQGVV